MATSKTTTLSTTTFDSGSATFDVFGEQGDGQIFGIRLGIPVNDAVDSAEALLRAAHDLAHQGSSKGENLRASEAHAIAFMIGAAIAIHSSVGFYTRGL